MVLLTCPWCGAPLPRIDPATAAVVTCAYCASTSSLTGQRATSGTSTLEQPSRLLLLVIRAFKDARGEGARPFDALIAAARRHLGAMGETDAFARVVMNLAIDFDREHGTTTATHAGCLAILVELYLSALPALRERGQCLIERPAFDSVEGVPIKLERLLTLELVTELAAREVT